MVKTCKEREKTNGKTGRIKYILMSRLNGAYKRKTQRLAKSQLLFDRLLNNNSAPLLYKESVDSTLVLVFSEINPGLDDGKQFQF